MKIITKRQTVIGAVMAIFGVFLLIKLDFNNPRVGDNSFSRGFFRQFWGPDHLAICIAIAIYACVQIRRIPYLFLLLFFLGGFVGYGTVFSVASGLQNHALTLMLKFLYFFGLPIVLASLGLQFLREAKAKPYFIYLLAMFSGFCNGMRHGGEMPTYLDIPTYGFGVIFSTFLLLLIGIAMHYIFLRFKPKNWEMVMHRLCGIGLIGVALLTAADEATRFHFGH